MTTLVFTAVFSSAIAVIGAIAWFMRVSDLSHGSDSEFYETHSHHPVPFRKRFWGPK